VEGIYKINSIWGGWLMVGRGFPLEGCRKFPKKIFFRSFSGRESRLIPGCRTRVVDRGKATIYPILGR